MQKLAQYFRDSWTEVAKVTWPNRKQAVKLTAAVLIFSLVIAIYIALLDVMFSNMLQKLILKV